jgi:DNA-binding transcriptional ArsR family regulator
MLRIDDEAADEVFDALSSRTAREILAALHEETRTASELAEIADTSLQNVKYHLDKFDAVGLAAPVGTAYSEKGREMTVYGPTNAPLVLTAGGEEQTSTLRALVKRLFGGVVVLAGVSVLVGHVFRASISDGAENPPTAPRTSTPRDVTGPITRTVSGKVTPTGTSPPTGTVVDVDPGLVFFAGGAFVLLLVAGWYLVRK